MNVKTTYLLCFMATIIAITSAKAQIKLGVPVGKPNSGAILDASNTAATATTYKGIYLPQVALTANNVYGLNTVGFATPVDGIMVYNSVTAGTGTTAVTPGIYIWSNSVWNKVNTSAATGNEKNIYEGNGTLTGNRNVSQAGFNLGFTGGNVGIGTAAPANQFHVVAATATDPVRFTGLQPSGTTVTGTLVTDNTGVIKVKSASTISSVCYTGTITVVGNNTSYFNDITTAPTKVFDNLSEFSGHTFTPVQAGLYQVTFKITFDQRTSASDNGDGYMGYAYILAGSGPTAPSYSSTGNKVTLIEAAPGTVKNNTVINTDLVKLTAGQVIQFQALVFGSSGNNTASYMINIVRMD